MRALKRRVTITVFGDPMQGLCYESEPLIERLRDDYGDTIAIRYVMSLLVRDVSDFMLPKERAMEPAEGIRRYCARLADIYRSEEAIGGLPLTMEGFCLFDEEHRTSRPLYLAYEAARICDPDRADAFLTALRHATVADCRPTTHDDEILRVVRETGIDEEAYLGHYRNGSAEAALERDLALTHRMGIHSLPSYLVQLGSEPW